MSAKNMIANRYEVVQHLGQGGMADVFLAVDTILNRHVAVKILRADLSTDTTSILRFEREAHAATSLSHRNIVEVYDVGDYKGHHYIVMEYVQGKNLKQVIKDRAPLLNEEAVDIMKQLVSAISEAHKRGIIHRDIKPQNIIVKSDGTIKILDFGIATAKGSMQLTQANNVMGSVHYLAPELAKGEPATAQSDIYAMGIVLYEMLTGDVPFKADQAVQIALMHMRDPLPSIRQINPQVPQSLENVVLKAAAKNPNERYASSEEMLQDLRTCLSSTRENEKRYVPHPYKGVSASKLKDFNTGRPTEEEEEEDYPEEQQKKPMTLLTKILIGILSILLVIAVAVVLYSFDMLPGIRKRIEVPSLTSYTLEEAQEICKDHHLVLDTKNVTYSLTEDVDKGLIISSDPSGGEEVKRGTSIQVTVSSGLGVVMPDYTGENIQDAQKDLQNYPYLTVHAVEQESDAASGTILNQTGIAPGQLFDPNSVSEITLVYASYHEIQIPDSIYGMDYHQASEELKNMGIKVYVSEIDPSTLSEEELKQIKEEGLVGKVKYWQSSDGSTDSVYTQRENNYLTLYYYTYKD